MSSSFTPLLTLSKIFCVNSSKSSTKSNKFLVVYSVCFALVYTSIVIWRFSTGEERQSFILNKVVAYLHIVCYIAVFFSNILSNWLYSRSFSKVLAGLEHFDKHLYNVGIDLSYKRMKRAFYVSISVSVAVYFYFAITDFLIDGLSTDFVNWLSIYIPITVNYFTAYIIIFIFYLLNQRYSKLKTYLDLILSQGISGNVKHFTNFFLELNHISNSLLLQFSLQLSAMFLFILVSVTTNAYMILKMRFDLEHYVLIVNSSIIHCAEIVGIVFAFYFTILKSEEIIAVSPKLITGAPLSKTTVKENMECFFLIRENRLKVRIFGMFVLEPSVLLSMAATIVSYLIILIQFKDSENMNPFTRSFAPVSDSMVRHNYG